MAKLLSLFLPLALTTIATPCLADMTATIAGSGSSPVRIDSCAASYGKDVAPTGIPFVNATQTDTNVIGAAFDFTNVGGRAISTIRFSFRELDAFDEGQPWQVFAYDWNGNAAPGESFTGNRTQGYNLTGGDVAKIVCTVAKVRYADGSIWSADSSTATAPGLYYPPTPSPMSTPKS